MVRRVFWLAAGLGAGATSAVLTMRWLQEQRQRMAPANVARQAAGVARDAGALFAAAAEEFRRGAAERETELWSAPGRAR